MQNNTLLMSTIGAWIMAFIYDGIERMTGWQCRPLIYVALVVVVAGLYYGLYTKNKNMENEEAN